MIKLTNILLEIKNIAAFPENKKIIVREYAGNSMGLYYVVNTSIFHNQFHFLYGIVGSVYPDAFALMPKAKIGKFLKEKLAERGIPCEVKENAGGLGGGIIEIPLKYIIIQND